MKIISGASLLGMFDALNNLRKMEDNIGTICKKTLSCKFGHRISGGDLLLDQIDCLKCGNKLFEITNDPPETK